MAVVVQDTFTGTNGTALTSHVGEIGATWTRHGQSGDSANPAIQSNEIRAASTNTGLYYPSGIPASAEYDVEFDLVVKTAVQDTLSLCGRMDANGGVKTYYSITRDLGNWVLRKVVSGSFTTLATVGSTLSAATTYRVKLQIRDASKKFFLDGVEILTSADNAITAVGVAGFEYFSRVSPNFETGYHIDNFLVTDLSAPPIVLFPRGNSGFQNLSGGLRG